MSRGIVDQMTLFDDDIRDFANEDRKKANPTRWEATKASPPLVNGPGYIREFDEARIKGATKLVFDLMKDKQFRTLSQIHRAINKGSEAGISATLRNFRKERYGLHTVNRRRTGDPKNGLFEYQLIVNERKH